MKTKLFISAIGLVALFFTACNTSQPQESKSITNKTDTTKTEMKTNKEIIVDVRTTQEWNSDGHADCSVNYPLDQLQDKINELKAYDHVVLVCRSGGRAESAKRMLESAGIKNVENMGPWQNIQCPN